MDHFHRAVHVAVGDADEARGHTGTADLHGVRIGTGCLRRATNLDRNAVVVRHVFQQLHHLGVHVRPTVHHRPGPAFDLAQQLLVATRCVGGVAHIHGNAHRRGFAVRGRGGSTQADLLRHGGHTHHGSLQLEAGEQPQGFHHHPHADLVVHRRGGGVAVLQQGGPELHGDRIAGAYQGIHFRLASRADVEPQVRELRHFLAFLRRQQVDRLAGQHTGDRPAAAPQREVLPKYDLDVPPADRLHGDKAFRIHMLHHQCNLIAVPGQQHLLRGLLCCVPRGEEVAMRVLPHRVCVRADELPHLLLDLGFVTRRAGRVEERG